MADSTGNGQMNFNTDLSALNKFIQSLQEMVDKTNSTNPQIRTLITLFNELDRSVLSLNSAFQGLKTSADVTSNFQSIIEIVNSLKTSFNGLGGGSRSLNSFINNVTNMSNAMERLSTLSTQFNAVLTEVNNKPNVGNKQMLDFFTRLQTLLTNVTNNFRSLMSVVNELGQLNTLINEMIGTFTRLNSVSTEFNHLMQNTQAPANVQVTENYFREMITLIERLNILYQGLSNSTGGLNVLTEGMKTLDGIMNNLVSVTSQFNQIIQSTSVSPSAMNLAPYFEQLMVTVNQLDQSFKTVLVDASNMNRINEQFTGMEQSMRSLVTMTTQLDTAIQRTAQVPNTASLEQYFRNLVELVSRLDVEFQNFAGVNKNLQQVAITFRELNKTVSQMQKITTKLGSPEDISKMETNFNALVGVIKNLVTEINALDMNGSNFTQLNEVLKNLGQTMKTVSTSSNSMNSNVGKVDDNIRMIGSATREATSGMSGFNTSFNRSFGSNPLGMLSKMHMGINNLRFGIQGLVLSLGGRELWNWLIGTNQQIEVLQSSLEVTLKSAQAAEDAVRSLRSYAALTPFQELETFQAGEMFAANRMDIDKWIRVAGDLSSAKRTAGVQLEDVVNVLTRINAGDFGKAMIRLRQMGISLNDLRQKGLEFTKNNTYKGDTDEMLSAIEQIIEERYGGLTEKLGQTTEGLISTVKDFFLQLGIQMGDVQFNKLREWLLTVKTDLKDFQNSMEFKKIIQGFNEFMDGTINFLKPFAEILGKLGILLVENLPLIGKLLQMLITMSLIKGGLGLFQSLTQGIATISANWMKVNAESTAQVAILREQGILLTQQQIQLAKINALRKAGTTIMTEQTMSELMKNELSAVGGVNATSSSKVAAKMGGLSAGVGAVVPEVLAVVMGLQILGAGIDALSGLWKKHSEELTNTVSDYDRMIGQQSEEQKVLERLNSARVASNDSIKYYTDLQNRATSATTEGTFSEEQKADITNRLKDAQQQLNRVNEQLIEISPDLVGALTDETGKLTDQTGAFDINTQSIIANINARKNNIDQMHQDQVEAAKAQNKILEQQMADDRRTVELANNRNAAHVGLGWGTKVLGGILGVVGLDPANWILSDAEKKGRDLTTGSESERLQFEQQTKINNIDRQSQIKANNAIIKESDDAKAAGFEQNGVIDWAGFKDYQKRQQDKMNDLQARLAATPQTFQDELDVSTNEQKRISRKYDIQLQEELVRNGNDTGGAEYQRIEEAKSAALQNYIDESIKNIKDIHATAKAGWDNNIGRVSGSLKFLLDNNIDPESIISALEQGNDAIQKLYKGRDDIIANLTSLYKDLNSKGLKPKDIRSVTNDYDTVREAEKAYQDTIDALQLERAQAAVKSMDKAKSSSALQEFNNKWNQEKEQMELKKDIALQKKQISGFEEGSSVYEAEKKRQDNSLINFISTEISALRSALSNGVIKEAKEKYQAQTQLLQLDKERNSLLLDIKKNTTKLEEFNKPGLVRAITYYDYKTKDAGASTIEIGDAKFVMQVQSLQTLDDVQKMMDAIKKYLGTFVKQADSAGYVNPQSLT